MKKGDFMLFGEFIAYAVWIFILLLILNAVFKTEVEIKTMIILSVVVALIGSSFYYVFQLTIVLSGVFGQDYEPNEFMYIPVIMAILVFVSSIIFLKLKYWQALIAGVLVILPTALWYLLLATHTT